MRIVHLSTFDCRGGAAQSALGLHRGLRELGEESVLLCQEKHGGKDPHIFVHAMEEKGKQRVRFLRQNLIEKNRSGISSTHYSFSLLPSGVASNPVLRDADVIHMHWVADFVSPVDLLEILALGKPVFWSLLDMRPFTGGCHFPGACTKMETGCGECPQLERDFFSSAYCEVMEAVASGSVHGIAHNEWMRSLARKSRVFGNSDLSVAPYDVNAAEFFPSDPLEARAALGVPANRTVLLVGADDPKDERKGLGRLLEEIHARWKGRLTGESGPLLLTMGGNLEFCDGFPLEVMQLGHLEGMEALRRAFVAADWFLLPTLEDNCPLLLLYSLGCGTPVVSFAAGGIPEVLNDSSRGFALPVGDWKAFFETLLHVSGIRKESQASNLLQRDGGLHIFPAHARKCRAIYHEGIERFQKLSSLELDVKREACRIFSDRVLGGMCDFGATEVEHSEELRSKLNEYQGAVAFLQSQCSLRAQLAGAFGKIFGKVHKK
jgi:glycosyltransferase involved in cell wall biosynthesis